MAWARPCRKWESPSLRLGQWPASAVLQHAAGERQCIVAHPLQYALSKWDKRYAGRRIPLSGRKSHEIGEHSESLFWAWLRACARARMCVFVGCVRAFVYVCVRVCMHV
jgi:hypothetical protein